jgi:hypothetical protein
MISSFSTAAELDSEIRNIIKRLDTGTAGDYNTDAERDPQI